MTAGNENIMTDYKAIVLSSQQLLNKHTLYSPIPHTVPQAEDDILDLYFRNNPFSTSQQAFLTSLLHGCIRNHQLISTTLEIFYKKTGARFLKSRYNFFAALCYVTLFMLDEISFTEYIKFVKSCSVHETTMFVKFIFDIDIIVGSLSVEWKTVYDHLWVEDRIVSRLLKHADDAQDLLRTLTQLDDFGVSARKSKKAPTEPEPFTLTVPNPRRFDEPNVLISTAFKAKPVPKSNYTGTGEKEALQHIKDLRVPIKYKQFAVAKRITIDKAKREKEIELSKIKVPSPVKFFKNPPALKEPLQIPKLNTTAILREDALVRRKMRVELESAEQLAISLSDPSLYIHKVKEVQKDDALQKKLNMERRHVEIQLVHEEAFLAKQDLIKEKREIVKDIKEERVIIEAINHENKRHEEASKQKLVKEIQESKLNIVTARQNVVSSNFKKAEALIVEKQVLKDRALKEAQEDRERKMDLIQQIRLLESMPNMSAHIKVVDKTETSGYGLLNEMSIIELQERLMIVKIHHTETQERKRNEILTQKTLRITQIAQKLQDIEAERVNRRMSRRGVEIESAFHTMNARDLQKKVLCEDPTLKDLFEKLEQKKIDRKALRSGILSESRPIEKKAAKDQGYPSPKAGLDDLKHEYEMRKRSVIKS